MGEYSKALSSHEQALEIRPKNSSSQSPSVWLLLTTASESVVLPARASTPKPFPIMNKHWKSDPKKLFRPIILISLTSYNSIGLGVRQDGRVLQSPVSSHEQALEIREKSLPANHSLMAYNLTTTSGWCTTTWASTPKPFPIMNKRWKSRQKTLPANHPDFAQYYSNIGSVYDGMGEYSKALSYYEQALKIRQKSFPVNHPDLATSYNIIGLVYHNMGEYSKGFSYYEQALEIKQKILPANHPSLTTSYNNIGSVYDDMGEYSKALSYYEQALEIEQKSLSANHPSLATSYSNIGSVYDDLGEYSKALSYYEQALEIYQKTLPANHPDLATSYNNIGLV